MLERVNTAKERWGGVHKMIDSWLNGRQALIVKFCHLSSVKPLSHEETPLAELVQNFCQAMMDYCSAGHFEIYERLMVEAREYADGSLEFAQQLVPRLDQLTTQCVDFNDRYDHSCNLEQLTKLSEDLSHLGEILEERFQLEDQLIERLHTAHRESVTE
ncbi:MULTISPECIES: sigma D regulator [unclassified Oceanobacter]|uniref:sigma D regulator n=1 Tax=unclassified Oceanobacter TaxID=2620260 RepID=UPI0026E3FB13|nr:MULTISPECIES: sigma D regulator [unclassified Oceanobacter]MDO6680757.1 sigma D regulator [Oceanobacter sp. 5_MG-2023]MDP2504525.1 sigma D regulator [Oceanobacter sp. 3_MG-2023]MDP2547021.1 sigma D regulator [Oceanobacter sp. 4_MG-2023]MDP2607846.1 sigma D regulator [Oceanobacter sp. 1_MG-2023]MDP2610970.1 sigma D regulator [Oceanobacter sp. 2_MG-2023]